MWLDLLYLAGHLRKCIDHWEELGAERAQNLAAFAVKLASVGVLGEVDMSLLVIDVMRRGLRDEVRRPPHCYIRLCPLDRTRQSPHRSRNGLGCPCGGLDIQPGSFGAS